TPSPSIFRVVVDGEGAAIEDVRFELRFPAWGVQVEGLSGSATLRYSSAASETRPGKPAFVYEIAPLRGRAGELRMNIREDKPWVFSLQDIDMRRFGA